MSRRTPAKLILLGVILAAIVVFIWLKQSQSTDLRSARPQTGAREAATDEAIAPENSEFRQGLDDETHAVKTNSLANTSLADPVIDSESDTPSSNESERLESIRQRLLIDLEAALSGDDDKAVGVGEWVLECAAREWGDHPRHIKSRVNDRGEMSDPVIIYVKGRYQPFQTHEDYLAHFEVIKSECVFLKSELDESLRERLLNLAQSGNTQARYLYALWPPAGEAHSVPNAIEWLEYTANAFEFTTANLESGHPLGVLAMAVSLGHEVMGMFTRKHAGLATSYYLASSLCGLSGPVVDGGLQAMALSDQDQAAALTQAEELSRLFCVSQ